MANALRVDSPFDGYTRHQIVADAKLVDDILSGHRAGRVTPLNLPLDALAAFTAPADAAEA